MNCTNPKKKITINQNPSHPLIKKNKYSISIYSNPFNINVPYLNKPKQSNITSIYKNAGEKISNINPKNKKHEHKLTISNILNILHTTTSTINKKPNQSLLPKKPSFKVHCKPSQIPAKTSQQNNSTLHGKNYSISISRRKVKNELGLKEDFFSDIEKKIAQMKKNKKYSFSIALNNNLTKSTRNANNQTKKIHHERATSFSFRGIPVNKTTTVVTQNGTRNLSINSKKNQKIKEQINKISNKVVKIKKSIIPFKQNLQKRITNKDKSISKETRQIKRPDSSSSKIKTTDATPHTTLQKDSYISHHKSISSFENSLFNYSNESNGEEDEFNDINSIVRKINFDNKAIDPNNIFMSNKNYDIFSKNFDEKFESVKKRK